MQTIHVTPLDSRFGAVIQVLETFRSKNIQAFVHGGALRDLFHWREPKDIDVVVYCWEQRQLVEALGIEPTHVYGFTKEKTFTLDTVLENGWEIIPRGYCRFIHTYQFPGIPWPVQVMNVSRMVNATALARNADFGINQIATEGERLYWSDAFIRDHARNQVVLRNPQKFLDSSYRALEFATRFEMSINWLSLLFPIKD